MLSDAVFPLFALRSYTKMYSEGNAILIETPNNTWILDDKDLEGEYLGERRLRIRKEYRYPLTKALFTIEEVIRCKTNKFIDSSGELITYKKSKFYTIYCKEVKSIEQLDSWNYRISIVGIKPIIYESYNCPKDPKYCLLVKLPNGYIVYGFTDEDVGTFRRKL